MSFNLSKKEREIIFSLFLENSKLKFSDIEKLTKLRSNILSYHLDKMQEQLLIEKKKNYYYLTKNAEKYIPLFSNIINERLSPLPVVLVAVINKNKILLLRRTKRPYKNYWGLIGGKILFEEDIKEAAFRIIKNKTSISSKHFSVNSVMQEFVKENNNIKHSFILFFTKVITNDFENYNDLKWFDIKSLNQRKIIPSDLWFIQNKLNSTIKIRKIIIKDAGGIIVSSSLF